MLPKLSSTVTRKGMMNEKMVAHTQKVIQGFKAYPNDIA